MVSCEPASEMAVHQFYFPLETAYGLKIFLGRGGVGLECARRGGGGEIRAICVHRGEGQKRPKNCVRTISMPPMCKMSSRK